MTLVGLNASGSRNHTRCGELVTSDASTSCSLPLADTASFPATLEYEPSSSCATGH